MLRAYYTHNQDIRQEILVIVYILLIIILRFYNIPTIGMKKKLASFSACGGSLLRQNSLLPHGDPRGAFLCHRTQFPMTQKQEYHLRRPPTNHIITAISPNTGSMGITRLKKPVISVKSSIKNRTTTTTANSFQYHLFRL